MTFYMQVTFDNDEAKELRSLKKHLGCKSWHDMILQISRANYNTYELAQGKQ